MKGTRNNGAEIYLEFRQVGSQVKVTAIDPVSMKEVSIIGPLNASQEELGALAIRKLRYVQKKEVKE